MKVTPVLMLMPAPFSSVVAIVWPIDPYKPICGFTKYDTPPESSRRSRVTPAISVLAHDRVNDIDRPTRGPA